MMKGAHCSFNIIYRAFNSYYCHEEGAMPSLVTTELRSGHKLTLSRSHGQGLAETRFGLWLPALNLRPFLLPQAVQAIVSTSWTFRRGEVMSSTWKFLTSTMWL